MVVTPMPSGLRERKKEKTRVALEVTAFRLFEENGYEATTVEEIAEASDVSPRTFFRYFGSKNEVVFGQQTEHFAVLQHIVEERVSGRADFCTVAEAMETFAEHLDGRREQVLARVELVAANASLQSRSLQVQRQWEEQLARLLAELAGQSTPDLDLRVVAGAAMTALCVGLRTWHRTGATDSLRVVVRRSIDALCSSMETGAVAAPARGGAPVRTPARAGAGSTG
jgi:AcrR family transcriptional regulator